MSEWIKTKDRLPSCTDDDVLFYSALEKCVYNGFYDFVAGVWYGFTVDCSFTFPPDDVPLWMELPYPDENDLAEVMLDQVENIADG